MTKRTRLLGAVVLGLAGFAGVCQASVFTLAGYRLNYGTLIVSGSFEYDATQNAYSNWNLVSDWSTIGGYGSSFTYTTSNSWVLPESSPTYGGQYVASDDWKLCIRASGVPGFYGTGPGEIWLSFDASLATLAPGGSTSFTPGTSPSSTGNYDARWGWTSWGQQYNTHTPLYGSVTREGSGTPEIPEPTSLLLLSLGLAGSGAFAAFRRRGRK